MTGPEASEATPTTAEARDGTPDPAAALRIVSGDPDAEELAALTAVLSAALTQLATQSRRQEPGASVWERRGRGLRRGLEGDWSRSLR